MPVEVTQLEGSGGANHGQQLMLQLPSGLGRGSVQVEIARGGFISQAVVSSTCQFACIDSMLACLCQSLAWLFLHPVSYHGPVNSHFD